MNAARWTLLFVLANLVASTVVTRLASSADAALPRDGVGYTAYSYAQQIWMLPQSIVTVSLVTALLPRMSRAVTEQRVDDLRADLSRALRISGVIIVPAAFFFLAFGPQIAQLLFAHGAANTAATVPLGHMLQAFGLGLIPFSAQYLLLRGFYAFEDTRTPFRMAVWISGINIALATACHLLLPPRWAVTGMAAAYALSYAIGLLLTALRLRRRTEGLLDGRMDLSHLHKTDRGRHRRRGCRVAHRPLLQPEPDVSFFGARALARCRRHRDGPAVPAPCATPADRGTAQPAGAGVTLAATKATQWGRTWIHLKKHASAQLRGDVEADACKWFAGTGPWWSLRRRWGRGCARARARSLGGLVACGLDADAGPRRRSSQA